MAQQAKYVQAGKPIVSLGPWVANQPTASPTFTEVGHTNVVGWTPAMENFDVESEQSTSVIKTVPVKDTHTIKIPALESRADLLMILLGQPDGSYGGTGDNRTVTFADRVERYYGAQIVVPGPGTTKVRTVRFWKSQITAAAEIQFGKKTVQTYELTMRVMRDDDATTAGSFGQQVDA